MDEGWRVRLTQMEDWYGELLSSEGTEEAEQQLVSEYFPYADTFARFQGRVLDIGGGAGLTRRFLPADVDYWVIDPSECWQDPAWQEMATRFGSARFVTGYGEELPFGDAEFDGALALWSLNHASDPLQCMREMRRVLKPGGRALVIFEDMQPTYLDIGRKWVKQRAQRLGLEPKFRMAWGQATIRTAGDALRHRLSGQPWPLQSDHVRIEERTFRPVLRSGFKLLKRLWADRYLSYELQALPSKR